MRKDGDDQRHSTHDRAFSSVGEAEIFPHNCVCAIRLDALEED